MTIWNFPRGVIIAVGTAGKITYRTLHGDTDLAESGLTAGHVLGVGAIPVLVKIVRAAACRHDCHEPHRRICLMSSDAGSRFFYYWLSQSSGTFVLPVPGEPDDDDMDEPDDDGTEMEWPSGMSMDWPSGEAMEWPS